MSGRGIEQVTQTVKATEADRTRVRTLVREGRWTEAERRVDPERLERYLAAHVDTAAPRGAEAIQGGTNELQAVRFLPMGARVRRAVGFVEVATPTSSEAGTGFLVSPRLFITNQHVIADAQAARGAVVTFDRELDESGKSRPTTTYTLDPAALAVFSPPEELDYALIAVGPRTSGMASLDDLGYIPLLDWDDKHALGIPVNIIQHPQGWPKMMAVRDNLLVDRTLTTLLYETDTEEGSSGSPVFNDDWELIALHHWGAPHIEQQDAHGNAIPVTVNEGVRITKIYEHLSSRLGSGELTNEQEALVREALSYSTDLAATAATGGRVLSQPHGGGTPGSEPEAVARASAPLDRSMLATSGEGGEVRMVVPLEITVRLGTGGTQPVAVPTLAPVERQLTRGAEAAKVDPNYDNRTGYDQGFIEGRTVPMPKLKDPDLASQLAPLRPELPDAAKGELQYEHFSVKLNKSKRIAIFTATNIDGPTYLEVDRTTGHVAASEGDTWFKDTRISGSYVLDQTFYGDWSTLFDRGHLTRRSDPTWGSAAEAERANADTFHFTNCSPQHWRFNESARFWQGVERYVLENGMLEVDPHKRLCVIQGPVFDDTRDRWADDVQIPSSFFKVVVWMGQKGLKSVGMVVDQLALLDEARGFLGAPKDLPSVDVSHWRVPIGLIEQNTGLDLGAAVRNGDTIKQPDQPAVGEEAIVPIRRFQDIRL
jgi:endonuclease G